MENFDLDGLFLSERKCRVCGEIKDLMGEFYMTHKGRGNSISAYSYECKLCTIKRVRRKRKSRNYSISSDYPDW
jgi:hypothetical protein